jgi:hypothetical protein
VITGAGKSKVGLNSADSNLRDVYILEGNSCFYVTVLATLKVSVLFIGS